MIRFFRRNITRISIGLVIMAALLFSAQASAAQETLGRTLSVAPATSTRSSSLSLDLTTPSFGQPGQHTECEFDDG